MSASPDPSAARMARLRAFIAQRPEDPFPRYALGLELKNAGQLGDAERTFADVMARNPDYTAVYLHAGQTLLAMGRTEDARTVFERGVQVCVERGDAHARSELEGALATLG